jgi:F-box/leucine-rich repeat protein 10/11
LKPKYPSGSGILSSIGKQDSVTSYGQAETCRLAWFVAERFTSDLRTLRLYKPSKAPRAPCLIHPRILSGLVALADFLISQCDILEHSEPEDKIRKLVWDRVPSDKVPDPIGLALELKWRVQRELGGGVSSESLKTEVKTNGDSQAKKARTFLPLDRQSKLRQLDYSHGEWQSEELPERTTTATVMQTRPLSSSASPQPDSVGEAAVQTVTIQSQVRRRVLSQGSTTVSQEQQVVFTTTQTIWEGEH